VVPPRLALPARREQRLHAALAAQVAADHLLAIGHADARGVLVSGDHRSAQQAPAPARLVQRRRAGQRERPQVARREEEPAGASRQPFGAGCHRDTLSYDGASCVRRVADGVQLSEPSRSQQ
jgi:hypothetical protein